MSAIFNVTSNTFDSVYYNCHFHGKFHALSRGLRSSARKFESQLSSEFKSNCQVQLTGPSTATAGTPGCRPLPLAAAGALFVAAHDGVFEWSSSCSPSSHFQVHARYIFRDNSHHSLYLRLDKVERSPLAAGTVECPSGKASRPAPDPRASGLPLKRQVQYLIYFRLQTRATPPT
ncbi:hypothetical protein FA95DRAFT_147329 [Auriscalpium vulgare]|uniref:Uncharacterized protein n=1 Tax=Auriscalpium vulgare TaxID=40419 RepID=A0ACB8S7W6_9AGAM|nr:hypothetical protein FA95DRAFT_147329 [Auriscalpium vulgare]